jgi:uncharacterized protein (TIGR03083 family)
MTPEAWIAAVRRESASLTAIRPVDFDVRVPACPDWSLADLLTHTGWVYRWWAFIAELPEGERANRERSTAAGLPKAGSTERPDAELVPWFQQSLQQLLASYERQPPGKLIDSRFWGQQPLSWIARRMAHETAIHRWDAEQALGSASAFDPMLAADGVDEFLAFWLPLGFRHAEFPGPAAIALEATDSSDTWQINVEDGTASWRRGGGAGDVVARGAAGDLYLFVWGRKPVEDLRVVGDTRMLSDWQTAAAI